jgi:[ribosomal protein S18]-alanine N-acetyltransferase
MDELIIREMKHKDVPSVLEIERLLFGTPWSEDSFLNEIYKKYAISRVAVIDENIVGYICTNYIQHEAHILNLAVHEDFQRRRIATLLMNEALKELKKKDCVFIYLEVRASNTGAKKFYGLFGFEVIDVRKKYYINPKEDALVMMGRL